ncbi:MAG: hypothetical protein QOG87_2308 [Actinomycetota bacterium]
MRPVSNLFVTDARAFPFRRRAGAAVLAGIALLLVACGEGDAQQIASNSAADRQTPGASAEPARNSRPAAATTTTAAAEVGATVSVRDDVFEPAEVTVAKGEAVAWRWSGTNPHNVSGSGFKSKIQTSGRYTRTFAESGRFAYRCEVHPGMAGAVVVTG